jgi:hypothetical protein
MRTRSRLLTAGLLTLAFLVSCRAVSALHGLFEDKDLLLDARLLGVWRADSSAGSDRWVVARFDTTSKSYNLAIADPRTAAALARLDVARFVQDSLAVARNPGDRAARERRARDSVTISRLYSDAGGPRLFELALGRLGGALFADITPNPLNTGSHLGKDLLRPVHWFWQASFEGDRVRLIPLDDDWLGAALDSGRVAIAHEDFGDEVVLIAPTADLQRFVAEHAQDTLAFPPKRALTLRR